MWIFHKMVLHKGHASYYYWLRWNDTNVISNTLSLGGRFSSRVDLSQGKTQPWHLEMNDQTIQRFSRVIHQEQFWSLWNRMAPKSIHFKWNDHCSWRWIHLAGSHRGMLDVPVKLEKHTVRLIKARNPFSHTYTLNKCTFNVLCMNDLNGLSPCC